MTREVAIIGVGMHPWGKFPDKDASELGVYAAKEAIKDAGIKWTDIQAVAAGENKYGGDRGIVAGNMIVSELGERGVPVANLYNACATGASVMREAYNTVVSGECDIVLAVSGDVSPGGFYAPISAGPTDTYYIRFQVAGMTNPAYWAFDCVQRMEEYGTTERHLAMAKVLCSKYGALNPNARYRKQFTVEDVLNSPMVVYPLRLFEICAVSDGAAAAIICSMDKARQLTKNPITVAGVGLGSPQYGDISSRIGVMSFPAKQEAPMVSESASACKMAYERAGMGPEDMDLLELPDNSSWHYLQYLETLGFCEPGGTERLIDEGQTEIGGKIPTNMSGGFASFGEAIAAQTLAGVCEVTWQLRGQSGQRQVEGAKAGIIQTYGAWGNSGTVILKK
ncbi:lipid-transfer protein [Chloroflexota bacterium]